jgi:hypothetical protein
MTKRAHKEHIKKYMYRPCLQYDKQVGSIRTVASDANETKASAEVADSHLLMDNGQVPIPIDPTNALQEEHPGFAMKLLLPMMVASCEPLMFTFSV